MLQLTRLTYISRSTLALVRNAGIEPQVRSILTQSRNNNRRNGVVGVLYFGDGCFFQCLEGEESAINTLYARLQADDRHKDLQLLLRENIFALTYADWVMRFAPVDEEITRLLKERGLNGFDPYRFDSAMVQKVMSLLRTSIDPPTDVVENLIRQSTAFRKSMPSPAADRESGTVRLLTAALLVVGFIFGAWWLI